MAALDPMYSVSECPVGMPASIGEYFPSWGSSTAPPSTASTSSTASSYTETSSYPYATATATAPMEDETPTYPHMTPTAAALDPLFASSERLHSTAMVRAVPPSLQYQNYLGLSGFSNNNSNSNNTIRRSPNMTPYLSQFGSSYVPRVDPYVTTGGSSKSNSSHHMGNGNGGSGPYSSNTRNHLRALQDRDDDFARGLPDEIIAEQHRILSSIKSRSNQNSNSNDNDNDDRTGKSTLSSASIDSYIAEQQAALDLYRSGNSSSTKSHCASTERNNGLGELVIAQPVGSPMSYAAPHPAEIHPQRFQMKRERKAKTAVSATTGAIVGGLLTGPAWPLGAAAGAAVGGYTGKVKARAGERKAQRDWEKRNVDAYVKTGAAGVQQNTVAYC
eukprot:CAMPEP_0172358870 /NCGR_PEP_ID=MMETSP1060-20121228/3147_1 /TAXON_ID=37318 /ORGANISM="Pseudo-nitzschia pungens, Strain cf. cingulata" /LENGTH=387 /DNA_ID=CAMNT_0013080285 /DNA_START=370 /DNA_END=1533 /DNA_ORIENTATION=+